jgi:outer membrane protein assembly factor BamD
MNLEKRPFWSRALAMKHALLIFLLPLCGCAALKALGSATDDTNTYAPDAETNLKRGDEALASGNHQEAIRYFEFVKTKFPFVESSKTAELRMGDAEFARDQFSAARERYYSFVRLHPTHPQVDYAAFRAALTHYRDIPSDFFLLPPSQEKDQVEVRNAANAMEEFVRNYPTSSYVPEAQKVVGNVKKRLASHELYVASFYRVRARWPAVVGRLKVVAKTYPGVGVDEEVYFGLHEAYLKLNQTAQAREALESFVKQFPADPGVPKAKSVLAAMTP